MSGKEVCGKLIQALIAVYLGDDARTDAISMKLREVCPALYNQEDALRNELSLRHRNSGFFPDSSFFTIRTVFLQLQLQI